MATLGLALCTVWFLTLFVLRSLIFWTKTGFLGINTFKGRIGSLAWCATTMSATVGILLAPISPVATLYNWPMSEILYNVPLVHWTGAGISGIGIFGGLAAQLAMGESWRIGVDESERTKLVTDGMFRYVRNPIFSFIGVSMLGFFLTVPNWWALIAIVLTTIGIQLQVRFVEEPHLLSVHSDEYARYLKSVGRFIPRIT